MNSAVNIVWLRIPKCCYHKAEWYSFLWNKTTPAWKVSVWDLQYALKVWQKKDLRLW